MGNLNENSSSYYDKNYYYELFSNAEDYPKLVNEYFINNIKVQNILDAGCGTGKFTKLFEKISKNYIGIDKSEDQIKLAKSKNNKSNYIISDLKNIPLIDKSIDISVCPWVLGTIKETKRNEVLEELIRVTKDKIILIENLEDSEFEKIRLHDKDKLTSSYLKYLEKNNFLLEKTINTYFYFESIETAKNVFLNIYNKEISNNVTSNIIKHKVGIYILEVNK